MKYEQFKDNVWITPVREKFKIICCDCGLVHDTDFRINKGNIQFKVNRNNCSTALTRRKDIAIILKREEQLFLVKLLEEASFMEFIKLKRGIGLAPLCYLLSRKIAGKYPIPKKFRYEAFITNRVKKELTRLIK
jgi:hypothetical protein